jgi:hypothetical protein
VSVLQVGLVAIRIFEGLVEVLLEESLVILEIIPAVSKVACLSSDILVLEVDVGKNEVLHLCFPIFPSISISCFPSVAQVLGALESAFDLLRFVEVVLELQAKNVLVVAPAFLED